MPKHSTSSTKIPRARNKWILYRTDTLKTLSPVDRRRPQQELSRLIAAKWRQESTEIKDIYSERADMEKTEHKRLYPDYVFRPQKKNRGNSTPEEKPTARKRKPNKQKAPPSNLNQNQAVQCSAPPTDSAEPPYLPRIAWEELANVDYAYYLNGMNHTQASGSQGFQYFPYNFSPGIDSLTEPPSMGECREVRACAPEPSQSSSVNVEYPYQPESLLPLHILHNSSMGQCNLAPSSEICRPSFDRLTHDFGSGRASSNTGTFPLDWDDTRQLQSTLLPRLTSVQHLTSQAEPSSGPARECVLI